MKTIYCYPSDRRGSLATEVVVAASILMGIISLFAPLAVRITRIHQDARHYRLTVNELSNHLDRLTSLAADERETAIRSLELSPAMRTYLPEASIAAETIADGDGTRVVIRFNRNQTPATPPLTLVAWVESMPPANYIAPTQAAGDPQ